MGGRNDILWKGILEEVFDDFLKFFFPQADKIFDLQRGFEYLDKELNELYPDSDKGSGTRLVDKLVKVFRRDGKEEWLLVHIEVQGYSGKNFAERMFRYYYRLYDRYRHPITAIAIFTNSSGKDIPNQYVYDFLGTHLTYRYNTCCITDYSDKVLAKSSNPFALVMLTAREVLSSKKGSEEELKNHKLMIARSLIGKRTFTKRKIQAVLFFLRNYVRFEDAQISTNFTKELDTIINKKKVMNIFEQVAEMRAEEGLKKGIEKAQLAFVKNLLKGSDFSMIKIASLANVSLHFVKKVKAGLRSK